MRTIPNPNSNDPFATLVTLMASALAPARAVDRDDAATGDTGRSWLHRLDAWLWRARQRDLDRALAGAADIAEVERRLRARERRLMHSYY